MIIITGGAGFIGSNLAISLQEAGYENLVICDFFGTDDKWKNLRKHIFSDVVLPQDLPHYLEKNASNIDVIFHLGGISSTTELNVDALVRENVVYSGSLWDWCSKNGTRFIYASSCATYGAGENGYRDDDSVAYLSSLRPLSPYAWSKHVFDIRVAKIVADGGLQPPQWVCAKMFSIYGPNEYHKAVQQSVLAQKFPRAEKNLRIPLYRSQHPHIKDGEQIRDFMYVLDCCDVLIWLMEHKEISGVYNVGTGKGHSFNYLTECLFKVLGRDRTQIDYVDMPPEIADKYQYVAQADMQKLLHAGYNKPFTSLEDGVKQYIKNYLEQDDIYR